MRSRRTSVVAIITSISLVAIYACFTEQNARAEGPVQTWYTPPRGATTEPPTPTPTSAPTRAPAPEWVPPIRSSTAPDQQPPIDLRPPLSILPSHEDKLMDPRMARSWAEGHSRWFVATTVDLGFVYLRPRASVGYGKPFTKWFGIDANPIFDTNGIAAYAGLRLEIPYFDLRVGPRFFWAFERSYLPAQTTYARVDVDTTGGAREEIWTYEAEATSQIPAGPGSIFLRGSLSYVDGIPDGELAFEETLKVIVPENGLIWRARAGYLLRFGSYRQHSIGIVGDFIEVPDRRNAKTARVGPVIRFVLSRRVEIRGTFVATVASPDRLGLEGSDFTELGVRYRWASE